MGRGEDAWVEPGELPAQKRSPKLWEVCVGGGPGMRSRAFRQPPEPSASPRPTEALDPGWGLSLAPSQALRPVCRRPWAQLGEQQH